MPTRPNIRTTLLTEARRLGTMLLEARVDFLKTNYLPRIEKAIPALHVPAAARHDIEKMPGETEAERVFNYVVGFDPDTTKKNAQWLLNLVLLSARPSKDGEQEGMRLEDGYKATRYLQLFAKAKPRLPVAQRDLGSYRSLSALFLALKEFDRSNGDGEQQPENDADPVIMSKREESRLLDVRMHNESKVIYNGPDYKVLIPQTQAASCYFGINTEWCNAATESANYFDDYNEKGPIYFILHKPTNRRWQIHFEEGQFMDENDYPVNAETFVRQHPKVAAIFEEIDAHPLADDVDLSWWRGYAPGFGVTKGVIVPMHDRKGLILKTARGLLGRPVFSIAQRGDGVVVTHDGTPLSKITNTINLTPAARDDLVASLNEVKLDGNTDLLANMDIYSVNARWGSLAKVGKPLFRFRDGLHWAEVKVRDERTDIGLFDGSGYRLVEARLRDTGEFSVRSLGVKNKKVVGDHLVSLMIAHKEKITKWTSPGSMVPTHKYVVPSDLNEEQARRLCESRVDLADFATIHTGLGDSETTRVEAVRRLREQGSDTTGEWIEDRLVIGREDNVLDLAELLTRGKRWDNTNWMIDILRGEETLELPDMPDDMDAFERLISALPASDLLKIGRHLEKVHPDAVAEMEHFDPTEPDDVWALIRDTEDHEVMSALRTAYANGVEAGTQDEIYKHFEREVERNGYILFEHGHGRWSGKITATDAPVVFAIPLKTLAEHLDRAENWGLWDWVDEMDAKLDLQIDSRHDFSGYSDEVARDTLMNELHAFATVDSV